MSNHVASVANYLSILTWLVKLQTMACLSTELCGTLSLGKGAASSSPHP